MPVRRSDAAHRHRAGRVREEHVLARARGQDRPAGHPPRPPLLEARLGRPVGDRVAREATWRARRRRVDRRRQLPRDARSPPRARGHRRVPRRALVALLRTGAPARVPDAGRAARRVRLLGLAAVARRVAAGLPHLAGAPLRPGARARDHLAARVSTWPSTCSDPSGRSGSFLDGLAEDADQVHHLASSLHGPTGGLEHARGGTSPRTAPGPRAPARHPECDLGSVGRLRPRHHRLDSARPTPCRLPSA